MNRQAARERMAFFATPEHPCSYLPDRRAVTVFAEPTRDKTVWEHTLLTQNGFRRSGEQVYRPQCPDCRACEAVRIPVRQFRLRRRHRRALQANCDVEMITRPARFDEEHFALYRRYQSTRHAGGEMDNPTPREYRDFLISPWSRTVFYEFREGRRLLAVAVTDQLLDGLSAVYTFFEPGLATRSLGVYAVLRQIEETRRLGLEWLYLGYWIPGCAKMVYKAGFQPQERFVEGRWGRKPQTPSGTGAFPGDA